MALQVTVTNLTGHKPPNRLLGRSAHVAQPARCATRTAGSSSKAAQYDPSSAVLTEDAQARVYEVLQGIWNYTAPAPATSKTPAARRYSISSLNDCIAKDSRIPPLGFYAGDAGRSERIRSPAGRFR